MCSLFGLVDYQNALTTRQKNRILQVLCKECEVRGTDATGIAYNFGGSIKVYKRPLAAHKLKFHVPNGVSVVMGHTRLATQGKPEDNFNNHPWSTGTFALAHNGVLWNDRELRQTENLPDTRIQTDSYVAVQLLEQQKTLDSMYPTGFVSSWDTPGLPLKVDRQTTSTITHGQPALLPWRTMAYCGTTKSFDRPRSCRILIFRPTAMSLCSCSNNRKPWTSRPSAQWRRRSRVRLCLRCSTGTIIYTSYVVTTRLRSSTSAASTYMLPPRKFCGRRCASCTCITGKKSIPRRAIS